MWVEAANSSGAIWRREFRKNHRSPMPGPSGGPQEFLYASSGHGCDDRPDSASESTAGDKRNHRPSNYGAARNLEPGREILADYLFSNWGTVSPVRRQDDYGIDLYCTLTERVGQRARVQHYFSVQVKSTEAPWIFNDRESVVWLVQHPVTSGGGVAFQAYSAT